MSERTQIAGVSVNVSNMEQALAETERLIEGGGRHYVCFFEGNTLHWARSRSDIRDLLNSASLCYPDGIAVAKLMSWKLGRHVERVSGPTFLLKACEYGISRGVNDAMRQYSWGLSKGEFMTIYVCDAGIYKIQAMLYDVIETKEAQPIISAQEAVTKLIEAAQVYPFPISAYLADGHVIDSISLVYLPQAVKGDGVDVIGDFLPAIVMADGRPWKCI
mgnify:CR=1 FL=1